MPEKSGIDALCVTPAGPTAGAAVCPQAGTAAATTASDKPKVRHCRSMVSSFDARQCSSAQHYPKNKNARGLNLLVRDCAWSKGRRTARGQRPRLGRVM
jgi:hypothetical protein